MSCADVRLEKKIRVSKSLGRDDNRGVAAWRQKTGGASANPLGNRMEGSASITASK